ncbi:MAG: exodeoxyribonuclease VII large subunit [Alphaproteobacteria bacterium]|nr:exodeoxyribonuclease VII large subunit [Alphaproteobacteria bacterium]
MPNDAVNNAPYSVSELSFALKRTVESNFAHVRVRGELSKVKIHTSGHMYSDLKDADSLINLVCWRSTVGRLAVKPEEGLEVICTGKVSTYPGRSSYQLIVEQMELAGQGALLKMLEERKKKLAAEGLFEQSRKRALPKFPQVIGVVTSATGAVIHDILHRLQDRYPCHVLLWPVPVQGEGAAEKITEAINGFQNIAPRPDILIVARGGGSLEDLMPFNEENVVRAAAASQIPLISAVGHETDVTLIDYAADMRAPTPTGAAEIATPNRMEVMAQLGKQSERLGYVVQNKIRSGLQLLATLQARLGTPQDLLNLKSQKLDQLAERMASYMMRIVDRQQSRVEVLAVKLAPALKRLVEIQQARFTQSARLLETLSYTNVLKRGYAVVKNEAGKLITSAKTSEKRGIIVFSDGEKPVSME